MIEFIGSCACGGIYVKRSGKIMSDETVNILRDIRRAFQLAIDFANIDRTNKSIFNNNIERVTAGLDISLVFDEYGRDSTRV